MATTSIRELNKKNLYTRDQLITWKKFEGKYLNVHMNHFEYWKDGVGYVTVYEVRGMSDEVRENYLSVRDIINLK